MSGFLMGKRVLITGATGSLGGAVIRCVMDEPEEVPRLIRVFSRDEAKQYKLRATMERLYGRQAGIFEYKIGDVRNLKSLCDALTGIDVVIHTAALKHVPVCEKNTTEAVETNIIGAENLVHAVAFHAKGVEKVVALSTDKACEPFSLMGMTKAIQERIFAAAMYRTATPFVCVRMGNILMSRGSIVPLFLDQLSRGGPLTVTDPRMTRFFITLRQAARNVLTALEYAEAGQVYIPSMKAMTILRLAHALAGNREIDIRTIGIRPGEKLHDILYSKDETRYLKSCPAGGYLLEPLFNLSPEGEGVVPYRDFSSADEDVQMTEKEIEDLLEGALLQEGTPLTERCGQVYPVKRSSPMYSV
ncbi:MAG: polysaccharide biosynthesis protein [Spirochaetales bacterium]|nr:polysaccharide biosynthesis protein [Spirochaetales bacterium]